MKFFSFFIHNSSSNEFHGGSFLIELIHFALKANIEHHPSIDNSRCVTFYSIKFIKKIITVDSIYVIYETLWEVRRTVLYHIYVNVYNKKSHLPSCRCCFFDGTLKIVVCCSQNPRHSKY